MPGDDLTIPEAPDSDTEYLITATKDVYSAVAPFQLNNLKKILVASNEEQKFYRFL